MQLLKFVVIICESSDVQS